LALENHGGGQAKANARSGLLDRLKPRSEHRRDGIDYRAFVGSFDAENKQVVADMNRDFNLVWTNAMMKLKVNKDGAQEGYSFNNVRDSVSKTYQRLLVLTGLPEASEEAEELEVEEAEEDTEEMALTR
jgi:hypothetical protein